VDSENRDVVRCAPPAGCDVAPLRSCRTHFRKRAAPFRDGCVREPPRYAARAGSLEITLFARTRLTLPAPHAIAIAARFVPAALADLPFVGAHRETPAYPRLRVTPGGAARESSPSPCPCPDRRACLLARGSPGQVRPAGQWTSRAKTRNSAISAKRRRGGRSGGVGELEAPPRPLNGGQASAPGQGQVGGAQVGAPEADVGGQHVSRLLEPPRPRSVGFRGDWRRPENPVGVSGWAGTHKTCRSAL
jgi:hypothetical protein